MRFFTPLPNFLPWIKKEQTKRKVPVIECGCGDGDLLREMRAEHIPCLGIDPRFNFLNESVPIDLAGAILAMEAETCPIIRTMQSIILICRPCHSCFPTRIFQAMNDKSVMYYVGLEHNITLDVIGIKHKKVLKDPVGREGEYLWKIG